MDSSAFNKINKLLCSVNSKSPLLTCFLLNHTCLGILHCYQEQMKIVQKWGNCHKLPRWPFNTKIIFQLVTLLPPDSPQMSPGNWFSQRDSSGPGVYTTSRINSWHRYIKVWPFSLIQDNSWSTYGVCLGIG